jgi:hypothetical protein
MWTDAPADLCGGRDEEDCGQAVLLRARGVSALVMRPSRPWRLTAPMIVRADLFQRVDPGRSVCVSRMRWLLSGIRTICRRPSCCGWREAAVGRAAYPRAFTGAIR